LLIKKKVSHIVCDGNENNSFNNLIAYIERRYLSWETISRMYCG